MSISPLLRHNHFAAATILILVSASWSFAQKKPDPAGKIDMRVGDRVTLLGGTLIERMQLHNYLEALLTSGFADRELTFRNLGWSGDNVFGHARAVFGAPNDGFKRLEKDVDQTKPTTFVLHYGSNEAHQGEAHLQTFIAGYQRLLDTLAKRSPRMIIILPRPYETKSPPLPDPKDYNEKLQLYRDAIQELAMQRGIPTIDLAQVLANATDNGVHPTPAGHLLFAQSLAGQIGLRAQPWQASIDAKSGAQESAGVALTQINAKPTQVTMTLQSDLLMNNEGGPANTLRVTSLKPGKYALVVDGKEQLVASASQWANGVKLNLSQDTQQFETLRREIHDKNELFFHRHRPQNETYLFLFRKHEQGNNAVEIPQFDPLIATKEAEIAKLKRPHSHRLEIRRQ